MAYPGKASADATAGGWARVDALAAEHPSSGRHNLYAESCRGWAVDVGRIALTTKTQVGRSPTWTFDQLDEMSARAAGYFRSRGVHVGDGVVGILDRGLASWLVVLATWRLGAVYVPMFTGLGPAALASRLRLAGARIVVSEPALHERGPGDSARPRARTRHRRVRNGPRMSAQAPRWPVPSPIRHAARLPDRPGGHRSGDLHQRHYR